MQMKMSCLLSCLVLVSGGVAFAQVSSSPQAPTVAAQAGSNCAPTQTNPQQGTLQPRKGATVSQSAEPLSDKLAKSDGVLCPPGGVDSEIHAPTPNTGTMPVIPPPGSPGGDPSVRPK
jgi:hypothetical protein